MLLSRQQLAERWGLTTRTIDRRRTECLIPWVDLSGGRGDRPVVRFKLEDIEAFEAEGRKAPFESRPAA